MASYETDQYGGITSVKGEKTGFFHLEKINDREWFITPEGHGFVPVGISHIYGNDSEVTVKEQYGFDQKKWVDAWLDRYLELGFNSAPAGGTSPCRDKRGFIDLDYIEDRFIDKKLPFTTGVWQFPHPNELRFQQERPDIFSNYYADLVEKRAETVCTRHKDNPFLLGYYYGFGGFINMSSWINSVVTGHAGAAGRVAIAEILVERYQGDVSQFNSIYGTNCSKIEDIKTSETIEFGPEFNKFNERVYATADPAKKGDFEAISDAFAIRAYQLGHEMIKKYDPNHLILGMYVKAASFSPELWQKVIPYADVSSPQHINPISPHEKIYELTQKPIFVSDQTFGHGFETERVHKRGLTDEEQAQNYQNLMKRVVGDRRVCGVSVCRTFYDLLSGPLRTNGGAYEGIFDEHGNPREAIVQALKTENAKIYDYALNPLAETQLQEVEEEFLRYNHLMHQKV